MPARLREQTRASIDESLALHKRWHGAAGGRIRDRPRAAVRRLLHARPARRGRARLGARAPCWCTRTPRRVADEVALRPRADRPEQHGLSRRDRASPRRTCARRTACGWTRREQAVMADRGVKVLHCPGSNLKLGSGLAPDRRTARAAASACRSAPTGPRATTGSSMFDEMRLAATLQAVRRGPGALTARDAVWMATREGARALGLDAEIGSLEPGKRADFVIVDRDAPHLAPGGDPYSTAGVRGDRPRRPHGRGGRRSARRRGAPDPARRNRHCARGPSGVPRARRARRCVSASECYNPR